MTQRIMTVDVEPDLRSTTSLGLETLPKLLDYFTYHRIRATFFTVGSLLEKHETLIKEIAKKQEVASHSYSHRYLTDANSRWEMKKSKEIFDEFKIPCIGFRAPAFITAPRHFQYLREYGYKYDASLAKFYPGRYSNLLLRSRPFKKHNIQEFPMPTFVAPGINAGLPYLKLFHPWSKFFPKPYMFYLHPWEFIERQDLPKPNSLSARLLLRNSGKTAWSIFDEYINRCGGRWISCRDWLEKQNEKTTRDY